jgi:hypothetical protein
MQFAWPHLDGHSVSSRPSDVLEDRCGQGRPVVREVVVRLDTHVVKLPLPSQWLSRGLTRSRKTLAAIATTKAVTTSGSTGA